jgi:hypothetical protein
MFTRVVIEACHVLASLCFTRSDVRRRRVRSQTDRPAARVRNVSRYRLSLLVLSTPWVAYGKFATLFRISLNRFRYLPAADGCPIDQCLELLPRVGVFQGLCICL